MNSQPEGRASEPALSEAEDEIEDDDPCPIMLNCPGGKAVLVSSWEGVKMIKDAAVERITSATFEAEASEEMAFAFTRSLDGVLGEKVFVIKGPADSDRVYLFDEEGGQTDQLSLKGEDGFLQMWEDDIFALHGGGIPPPAFVESEDAASQNDDDSPQAAAQFKVGQRIASAWGHGKEIAWYGATVDKVLDDCIWACFDDGDIISLTHGSCSEGLENKSIRAMSSAEVKEGGLLKNETGFPIASHIVWYKEGGATVPRAVGVLFTPSDASAGLSVGTDTIFSGFIVNGEAFDPEDDDTRTRGTRASAKADAKHALQEAKGFHTFRRGDVVVFKDDPSHSAIVFGVLWNEASATSKGYKYLLLVEKDTHIFLWAVSHIGCDGYRTRVQR